MEDIPRCSQCAHDDVDMHDEPCLSCRWPDNDHWTPKAGGQNA